MNQVNRHHRGLSVASGRSCTLLTLFLLLAVLFMARAAEADDHAKRTESSGRSKDASFFQQQIAPLLRSHCVKCHGPGKAEAELDLSTPSGIAQGGASGPAIAAHDLDESLLWTKVEHGEMPPEDPLSEEDQQRLREWIVDGAAGLWNAEGKTLGPEDHWAFQPLVAPQLPHVSRSEMVVHPMDAFIEERLEDAGLSLARRATPAQLVRRVSLAITGLPPTTDEIRRFAADASPPTYRAMVEHYLASPHYGERWGKYWLDAVGYADSNGYFNADTDRPLAYRYRDYVIRALNEDRPFDLFVREQLAGDAMAGWNPGETATQAQIDQLIATHLLRNGQDGSGESDGNPDELRVDRYTALESCQQIVTSAFLGLTGQCAKCHDHKFEPISQADYYRLQAVFYPAFPAAHGELWQKPQGRIVHAALQQAQEAWEAELTEATRQANQANQALQQFLKMERVASEILFVDESVAGTAEGEWTVERRRPHGDHLPKQMDGWRDRWNQLREAIEKAEEQRNQVESERPGAVAWASNVSKQVPATRRLVRGNYAEPAEEMQPAMPSFLMAADPASSEERAESDASGSAASSYDRWQLACDLTTPGTRATSLMARVQVNRIWQAYFGTGIVATPENLGLSGAVPTHPELLDWLAHEWIRSGWSLKQLHRQILYSATFQQSSDVAMPDVARTIDAGNRLLWRFPLLRLDADALRDSMLSVTGSLDASLGGPYIPTQRDDAGEVLVPESQPGARRRSIYLQQRRTQVVSLLQLFDSPSIVFNATRRPRTTMPLQSLSLLNGTFTRARAEQWADQLLEVTANRATDASQRVEPSSEGTPSADTARVVQVYRSALARDPDVEELQAALAFVASQAALYAGDASHADVDPSDSRIEPQAVRRAWIDLCHGMLMSNEFLYVE